MRYRTVIPLPLLLGLIIGSLLCACSKYPEKGRLKVAKTNFTHLKMLY